MNRKPIELDDRTVVWMPAAEPQPGVTMVWTRAPKPAPVAPPPPMARGSSNTPLQQILPPALEREVFQLSRRIALQADLPAAVRVLQVGLCKLTGSSDALCIFFEASLSSAWFAPAGSAANPVGPQVQQLIAQTAASGQRTFLGRAIVEPVGAAPARAVLALRRSPQAPVYGPIELATLSAITQAVGGILGHYLSDLVAKRAQEASDARSPFRAEALAERRRVAVLPGRVVTAPRSWVKWAYPGMMALVIGVIVAAALIQVPTYSTGVAMITVDSAQVTSTMPGTVAEVLVTAGSVVAAGDPVVRMHATQEDSALAAAETDYRNALAVFLSNPGDASARTTLASLTTQRTQALAGVDARILRAPAAGSVGDVRVRPGQLLVPGAQIMKIVKTGATPSVIALLPGFDRPRLSPGMVVQIELPGYRKQREDAIIDSVDSQVIGPEEARRSLGDPIGDALPIAGPVVIVRAHLTSSTFEADGKVYELHDGMLALAEVQVARKSLLQMFLPGDGE